MLRVKAAPFARTVFGGVQVTLPPGDTLIFDGAGARGPEIVHVYAVESADLAGLPSGDRLAVRDSHTTVGWYDLAALRRGGVSVYPVGVLDLLG